MGELHITCPNGHRFRHSLGDTPALAGRDASCAIALDDPSASRRHARFSRNGSRFVVEDMGSKNGTLVNDAPATRHELVEGDEILIGSTLLVYHDHEPSTRDTVQSVVIAEDDTGTRATRYVSRDRDLLISQQRLRMLYELSERLTTLQNRTDLLESALQVCFESLHFERGAIGIYREGKRGIEWPVVRNLRGEQGELRISRTLLNRALEHGERAMFTEDELGEVDPTVSMVQQGIRSAMCVPLLHGEETMGVIYGDRTSTSTSYAEEDIDFLAGIARQICIGLVNARLMDEQRRMARLNHEIDLARGIQTALFPRDLPNGSGFKVAAVNDPGDRVSGDYYDVIDMGDGRWWILLADVTGEGVSASLLMANLQAAVRVTIGSSPHPRELLAQWNQLICKNTEASKFITCSLALVEPAARRMTLASAGHCPPILMQGKDGAAYPAELDHGFPLGVVEGAQYEESVLTVESPCLIVKYSDGVTEAMNGEKEQFGSQRLIEAIGESRDLSPQSLVKKLRKDITRFADGAAQSDDITILAALIA